MFAGLFRLGSYPGFFNPQPDGDCCWQREGPHIIVPFTEAHLSRSSGVGRELGCKHRPAIMPLQQARRDLHILPAGGDGHHKQGLLQGGNTKAPSGGLGTRRIEVSLSGQGPLEKHKGENDQPRKALPECGPAGIRVGRGFRVQAPKTVVWIFGLGET